MPEVHIVIQEIFGYPLALKELSNPFQNILWITCFSIRSFIILKGNEFKFVLIMGKDNKPGE